MEKGHADPPLYSRKQEINFPFRVPVAAQGVKNPTGIHEDAGLIPGFAL